MYGCNYCAELNVLSGYMCYVLDLSYCFPVKSYPFFRPPFPFLFSFSANKNRNIMVRRFFRPFATVFNPTPPYPPACTRSRSRTASNSARQSRLLPSQLSFPAAPPTEACPGPIHPSALRMASPPCSLFPPGARCGFLAPPCPLRAPGAAVPRACRLQAPAATVPRCGLVIRAPAAGSGR